MTVRASAKTLCPTPMAMLQISGWEAGATMAPTAPITPTVLRPTIHALWLRLRAARGAITNAIGTPINADIPTIIPACSFGTPASIKTCGNQPITMYAMND